MSFIIATFYHFVQLLDYYDMKDHIKSMCNAVQLKGTILLAEEGINATISGTRDSINSIFSFLHFDHRLKDLKWKESCATYQPFSKMKVRLKREIINFGVKGFDISKSGQYIEPEHWDNFISRSDVIVIDVRNEYETKLGKFKNAIDPKTQCFRDFSRWAKSFSKDKNSKIAMYCTGGIRCEKSTAYMKSLGFKDVYHLRGGVLSYLEKNKGKTAAWEGDCFVFDDRVAIDRLLNPSSNIKCIFCNNQVSTDELKSVPRGQVICHTCSRAVVLD